ncbi:hypothetical protein SLE2022_158340 [Rubroshorea leprosula]
MGDYGRNCKRNSAASEMEEVSSASVSLSKKSKIFKEFESPSPGIELEIPRLFSHFLEKPVSPATSSNSGGVVVGEVSSSICWDESLVSHCFSNESCEIVKESLTFVDLEAKSFETEISTCNNSSNKFSKETTPLSQLRGDFEEMDSTMKKSSPAVASNQPRNSHAVAKMPSQVEIDEFFSVAEKDEQKRFTKKYNYDIVKDVPLEGRYQWVRLKP